MVDPRQPFAKIAGTAIIGCQQLHDRPVDQRFVQKLVDVGLADLQIALRVQQKVPASTAIGPVFVTNEAVAGMICISPAARARLFARGLKPDS